MKKILMALIALIMTLTVIVVVGCSGKKSTPPPETQSIVEITLNKATAEIDINESIIIKATTKQTLEKVTFTTDKNDFITINADADGKTLTVTGKATGTTIITATVEGKTATCAVTVVNYGSVPTIKFKNCESSFNLFNGDTFTIEAVVLFRGKEKTTAITITSSDQSVISVNGSTLTANNLGQSTLTLSTTYEGHSVVGYLVINVLPSSNIIEQDDLWSDPSTDDFGGDYKW